MKKIFSQILLLFSMLLPAQAAASDNYGYTDERPLVIAADWDFQPFEFLNTDGQPSGYNIEVLDMILKHIGIPHKFVMQEWHSHQLQRPSLRDHQEVHQLLYTAGSTTRGHPSPEQSATPD